MHETVDCDMSKQYAKPTQIILDTDKPTQGRIPPGEGPEQSFSAFGRFSLVLNSTI